LAFYLRFRPSCRWLVLLLEPEPLLQVRHQQVEVPNHPVPPSPVQEPQRAQQQRVLQAQQAQLLLSSRNRQARPSPEMRQSEHGKVISCEFLSNSQKDKGSAGQVLSSPA
jgi:hypothetical protein